MNCREGEGSQARFRVGRLHCSQGKWYCTLRENETFGPFESKAEAQVELLFYLRENGFISSIKSFESLEDALARRAEFAVAGEERSFR